jgi:pseudouridine 5'-phosphatase
MRKIQDYQRKHFPSTSPLVGVRDLLQTLYRRTDPAVEIALATSSHKANFILKSAHLEDSIFHVFRPENRVLGDDERIGAGRGKPAPDIYLLALETINERLRKEGGKEIQPRECLVFEDSVPGVESGRRAGMQVVWCPHEGLLNEYRGREAEVLAGLTGEFEEGEAAGAVDGEGKQKRQGGPGEVGDGWGKLLGSLEAFPYADYGMNV